MISGKKVNIKPFSVNEAWQGRRFRTPEYRQYQWDLSIILPKIVVPEGLLEIYLVFGFSSSLSDFDNPVKPFVDCMQTKYKFNDKRIKRSVTDVCDVKKGEEFIYFDLRPLVRNDSFLDEIKNK